jgi:hypothetical protein
MANFLPTEIDQLLLYKSLIPISFQYITSTCSTTKLVLFVNTQTCKEEFDTQQKYGRKGMVPHLFPKPHLKKKPTIKKKSTLCPNMNQLSNCLHV